MVAAEQPLMHSPAIGMLPIRSAQFRTEELTFVFSQSDFFKKSPDLNIRPIPEWQTTIVFDPAIADLVQLSPTAGLLLELCGDGEVLAKIQQEFVEVVGFRLTSDEATGQVQHGLRELVAKGLVVTNSTFAKNSIQEMSEATAGPSTPDMRKIHFGPAGS
jgi:hypothetical protein